MSRVRQIKVIKVTVLGQLSRSERVKGKSRSERVKDGSLEVKGLKTEVYSSSERVKERNLGVKGLKKEVYE